jgi:hypothetical protein
VAYAKGVKKAAARAPEAVESLDARLEEMGRKMERLRSLYESFFMGSERAPPNVPRRELNRLMLEMQQIPISNATMRFRFQSLQQRWVLYTTYWNRNLQEIEAGTYRRDLERARRHLAARGGAEISEQEALALGIPANRVKAFLGRQTRGQTRRAGPPAPAAPAPEGTPSPPAPAPEPAPRPAASRLGSEQLAAFYRKYAEAHQRAVGTPPKVTPEQLRGKLEKLLEGQSFERVELDVTVDGGKIRVRAKPVR